MSDQEDALPVKWKRLTKLFEERSWRVDRISGSHYVFTKPGRRCIPLAFHGNKSLTRRYAKLVLRQAQIIGDKEALSGGRDETEDSEDQTGYVGDCSNNKEEETAKNTDKWVRPIPGSKALSELKGEERDELKEQRKMEEETKQQEQLRQLKVLEQVQCDVAAGKYHKAIASIEREAPDLVGSSDWKFDFSSDLIFFKLVSLTEIAFEHPFGSDHQHKAIINASKLSIRFMEAVRDRRQEARLLATAFQDRAVRLYLDEARQATMKYMIMDDNVRKVLSSNSLNISIDKVPAFATKLEKNSQLDILLECLHFVVDLYKLFRSKPCHATHAIASTENVDVANLVSPCMSRMLELFDLEEFEKASKAADTLVFVAENFRGIEMNQPLRIDNPVLVDKPLFIMVPKEARVTSQLVLSMATLVKALVPAYRFAQDNLGWSRLAGLLSRCREEGNFEEREEHILETCNCTVEGALAFSDMVLDHIASPDAIEDLMGNRMANRFMFSSLLDPIALMKVAALHLLTQNKNRKVASEVSKYIKKMKSGCHSIHDYSALLLAIRSDNNSMAELQSGQYDGLRRQVIILMDRLQKIADIYATYHSHMDDKDRNVFDEKHTVYIRYRFEDINAARYHLILLFDLLFNECSALCSWIFLYKALVVLLSELDFSSRVAPNDSTTLRGRCGKATESLVLGWWTFSVYFQSFVPSFLRRYTIGREAGRLSVLDGIGRTILKTAKDENKYASLSPLDRLESLESLAFALVSQLLQRGGRPVPESFIRIAMRKMAEGSNESPQFCRLVKIKAKRYAQKTDQLITSAMDNEAALSSCLESREKAVNALLQRFELCVLKGRSFPSDVKARLRKARVESLSRDNRKEETDFLVKHANCIHQWSYKDAEEINWAIWALQDSVQEATSFLHRTLHSPVIKSLSNPSWTQNNLPHMLKDFPEDAQKAILDVARIHDILKLANAAD